MNQAIPAQTDAGGGRIPRVSIAIPVYNGDNFLSKTVDSILSQTFSDFELIICDNASDDGTEATARSYAQQDPRVRYHRNPANIGWAGNHNVAIDLARGEYFKWAAHDDLLDPTFIEKCVQVLDADPDVVLCYPQTLFIDSDDHPISTYADQLNLTQPNAHQRFNEFFRRQSLSHPVFGLQRREVLLRTGRMGSFIMSDRVWIGEMALNGKIWEIPEPLFLRRLHTQISTLTNATGAEMLAWIDPDKNGRFRFPKWRRLIEYFRAIRRAKITRRERLACFLQLFRFVFVPDRVRGLFADVSYNIFPTRRSWMQ